MDLQSRKEIEITGTQHKDVKRRLQIQFSDQLTFYQKSKRKSEYVYHKSNKPIEEDERSWFFMNLKEKVEKVAEILRQDVESFPSPFQNGHLILTS